MQSLIDCFSLGRNILVAASQVHPEDIEAAANFWEAHAKVLAEHPKLTTIFSYLPPTIASGYLSGSARAAYLRKHSKTC